MNLNVNGASFFTALFIHTDCMKIRWFTDAQVGTWQGVVYGFAGKMLHTEKAL